MKTIKQKILYVFAFILILFSVSSCSLATISDSEEASDSCVTEDDNSYDDGRYIITEVGHIGNAKSGSRVSSE